MINKPTNEELKDGKKEKIIKSTPSPRNGNLTFKSKIREDPVLINLNKLPPPNPIIPIKRRNRNFGSPNGRPTNIPNVPMFNNSPCNRFITKTHHPDFAYNLPERINFSDIINQSKTIKKDKEVQEHCCLTTCNNASAKRHFKSLKLKNYKSKEGWSEKGLIIFLKKLTLQTGWRKICDSCYYKDRYQHNKLEKKRKEEAEKEAENEKEKEKFFEANQNRF